MRMLTTSFRSHSSVSLFIITIRSSSWSLPLATVGTEPSAMPVAGMGTPHCTCSVSGPKSIAFVVRLSRRTSLVGLSGGTCHYFRSLLVLRHCAILDALVLAVLARRVLRAVWCSAHPYFLTREAACGKQEADYSVRVSVVDRVPDGPVNAQVNRRAAGLRGAIHIGLRVEEARHQARHGALYRCV